MTEPWWPSQPVGPTNPAPQQGRWSPPPGHAPPASPATSRQPSAGPTPVPATAVGVPLPAQQRPAPAMTGLGILTLLLVLAALAFGWLIVTPWAIGWGSAIDPCLDSGGGWECIVNDAAREQVLTPTVAIVAALCLARGAGVERKQGRAIGYLYALLGFLVLVLAWSSGTP